jgi:microcystin-dependent protein
MSQPYIGEIRAFGFNFAPVNWAFCNGQPMNISDNPTLFNVIGTTYGGNGTTTFNMPNLQDPGDADAGANSVAHPYDRRPVGAVGRHGGTDPSSQIGELPRRLQPQRYLFGYDPDV